MPALSIHDTLKLSSGHSIPRLGFGVYQSTAAYASALAALKGGYRHIDSAQVYRNEAEVGRALRESGVPREQVYITTKIVQPPTDGDHIKSFDDSLAKLGSDYVDLFLIHAPNMGKSARKDVWQALERFQKDGKARSIGVSNYGVKHLEEMKAFASIQPAVNQIELHPFCQQKPIVEYCAAANIAVEAYCPIMRGQRFDDPTLQKISKATGKTVAQVLIRWSLQKGYVPLPKSDTPERIIANADVYDFELSREDMEAMDGLDQGAKGAVSWNPVETD